MEVESMEFKFSIKMEFYFLSAENFPFFFFLQKMSIANFFNLVYRIKF